MRCYQRPREMGVILGRGAIAYSFESVPEGQVQNTTRKAYDDYKDKEGQPNFFKLYSDKPKAFIYTRDISCEHRVWRNITDDPLKEDLSDQKADVPLGGGKFMAIGWGILSYTLS